MYVLIRNLKWHTTTLGKGLNIHLHPTPEYSPKLNESAFHESQRKIFLQVYS